MPVAGTPMVVFYASLSGLYRLGITSLPSRLGTCGWRGQTSNIHAARWVHFRTEPCGAFNDAVDGHLACGVVRVKESGQMTTRDTVVLLMGVSVSGKSTVGVGLAGRPGRT